MKEQSLSDKEIIMDLDCGCCDDYFYFKKDVKEFVKKLKDLKGNTVGEKIMIDFFKDYIDELAGDKLI